MSRNLAHAPEANAFHTLLKQADEADVRLTPGMAEGLARGNPRMIAYVADLIAVRGRRPAIEPREDGGPLEPGKTYTINERKPETVLGADGSASAVNKGQPAVIKANAPGYVLPDYANGDWRQYARPDAVSQPVARNYVETSPDANAILGEGGSMFGPPSFDDTPATPGTLSGPMPVMPKLNNSGLQSASDDVTNINAMRQHFPHTLYRHEGDMAVDWDGAPWAYGPKSAPGKDKLEYAGSDESGWWALLTEDRDKPKSAPIIQGPTDPHPGGYISTTPLTADWRSSKAQDPQMPKDQDDPANAAAVNAAKETRARRREADRLPNYFPDAENVPYIAVPISKDKNGKDVYLHGRPGDYVTVVDKQTGRYVHGIAADGRRKSRPEASVAMSRAFDLKDNGTSKDRFSYFVYDGSGGKNSKTNWPLTNDQIRENADRFRRLNPEVQAAIDAGYAYKAAKDPAPKQSDANYFPQADEDIARFGRLPAAEPPGLSGWRTPPAMPTASLNGNPPPPPPKKSQQAKAVPPPPKVGVPALPQRTSFFGRLFH